MWRVKRKQQSALMSRKFKISALPMCNSQRPVKSLQALIISMMSCIPAKLDGIQVKEKFEPMIVSKEPNHSLGGYSHREPWSRTRQKEKKRRIFFMQVMTMREHTRSK
jgi:hypothetical protein